MRIIADLHLHSCYSKATSPRMHVDEIAKFAKIKGLSLVGTGDFTHPKWLKELQEKLIRTPNDLYKLKKEPTAPLWFMVTTEVSTIFEVGNKTRKVHHVILTPNIEIASQINDRLRNYGRLDLDGRPILNMTAAQLVEEVMAFSPNNMVIPAHIWTPWYGVLGKKSGFNSIKECYEDMTKHIHAIETGLSSDPPMNWRLSALDTFALVSNSDSHSPWPWRIGREANVFELEKITYREITDAIKQKDKSHFKFTIEVNPAYGKYHWPGHRKCNISVSPTEARKLNNICPVCGRPFTEGVAQRVEELADRPAGTKPEGAIDSVALLPLSEIIAKVLGITTLSSGRIWTIYSKLVGKFGNEYNVLLETPLQKLEETGYKELAVAIVRVRNRQIKIIPGYDGVYGKLVILPKEG